MRRNPYETTGPEQNAAGTRLVTAESPLLTVRLGMESR
jgi:hypothetical protein